MNGINWIGLGTFMRREYERIMRIKVQTFVAPLVSAFLFIFIFGFVLGKKIDLIAGVSYMQFVFPGILAMNVLTAAFEHTSSIVYMGRWLRTIDEMLVSPFSYIEMLVGFVGSAVMRALLIGVGVLIIGLLFGAVQITYPLMFVLFVIGLAAIFALIGILVGLWANSFEQLGILNTFVIMPLSFLGGMFYSVELLPESVRTFTYFNPFFYFVDTMRYVTIGIHESNLMIGATLISVLVIGLSILVIYLFRSGWRIRH